MEIDPLKKNIILVLSIISFALLFTFITWLFNPMMPSYYLFSLFMAVMLLSIIVYFCYIVGKYRYEMRDYTPQIPADQGVIFLRDGSYVSVPSPPKYVEPKDIKPYVFYCSSCDEEFSGFQVFCPKCRKRMKRIHMTTINPDDNNLQKCVICHSEKCPKCGLGINGNDSCHEECPYCESQYHKHCWDITIEKFGKCGHCLEEPPRELINGNDIETEENEDIETKDNKDKNDDGGDENEDFNSIHFIL